MIYISIGSNLGDRLHNIQQALYLIKSRCIANLKCSIIIETDALLKEGAPNDWNQPFLNAICYGNSDISPKKLLEILKSIESDLGRPTSYEKWAPRLIDLDILIFNDVIMDAPGLSIPHPELLNRPFLLHLLSMLNPQLKHPGTTELFYTRQRSPQLFSKYIVPYPSFVGIVNVTSNSFSDGGLYIKPDEAIKHSTKLFSEGASVIDIGAQSTRPGAELLEPDIEYENLRPVLEGLDRNIKISLDSFSPAVIKKVLLHHKVHWINDQSGNLNDSILEMIKDANAKIVVMRSLSLPAQKDLIPDGKNIIDNTIKWMDKRLNHIKSIGIKEEDIILDPGIGFDHSIYQDISVLRDIEKIKTLGIPILVGHSRKSYTQSFSNLEAKDRDLETISISQLLHENKIEFIRIHNVKDHQRYFVARSAVSGGTTI